MKQKMRVGASAFTGTARRTDVHVAVVAAVVSVAVKWELSKAARRLRCHSRCDSCGPSDRQTSVALAACPCGGRCAAEQCCCPAVAAARRALLLEELLLFAVTGPNPASAVHPAAAAAAEPASAAGRLRRILLLRLRLTAWLARLVFAATPAAPMSLRLSRAIGRGRPQLWLGQRRFCCHACTSWHFAVDCIRSLASALPSLGLLSFCSAASRCRRPFRRRPTARLPMEPHNVRGDTGPERNLPRHLRTHDAFTVGVPFLPGASRHSASAPSTISLSSGSLRRMTATSSMRLQGQTSIQKRSSLLPDFACNSTLRLSGSVRFGQRFLG